MKLLRIQAQGLPLFKENLDIIFYAQQRVSEDSKNNLISLFSSVYLNPAVGFIGINASGKTSVLNVITLITDIINNKPINHSEAKSILGNTEKATIDTFFYSKENTICRLQTVITSDKTTNEGIKYLDKPAYSVQFHPEACGGPKDTEFLFDNFISMMENKEEK